LRGGRDYPRSVGEFLAWFGTDGDCRDYLAWLRWPEGFVCDECGHAGAAGSWPTGDSDVPGACIGRR
jgi:Transposase zinc-ribbon domain